MLIFQYGSNLSSQRLNSEARLRGNARVVGVARTRSPYRFCFPVWGGINGCAAAGILPGGPGPAWGVIYEVPEERVYRHADAPFPTLDTIEDEGKDYDRGPIDVCFRDGRRPDETVHTYHPRQPRSGLQTEWHYVQHILSGAAEHDLPGSYQQYLRDCVMDNNPSLANTLEQQQP
ncbi:gamma-glutamylcyclotransferase family protein [Natronospira bacteriovora]|uniref:Gamma-glutamylcyclotransferase family protein n=1 Tax=Natronospira bacteriovora TaxID=3069753 RepID=A0ABU0W7W5_9GAMM|nr:gamma-glutamylcyclotransferase family protein [Natronospira sp. AB-CW4]MDQ2069550.1 gamma-glutamylcyclotransferase family protein [Natronospira sp. AB-CW4]